MLGFIDLYHFNNILDIPTVMNDCLKLLDSSKDEGGEGEKRAKNGGKFSTIPYFIVQAIIFF